MSGGKSRCEVLVAACDGSMHLACETGLPIIHIDAVEDGRSALAALDANAHASGVRADHPVAPIALVRGWSRWRRMPVAGLGRAARVSGVSMRGGRITVKLPSGVPVSEFREQLHGALRHMRLQEIASGVDYLRARSAVHAHGIVQPRYTLFGARGLEPRLVTDLYVLDPAWQSWRLFWLVAAARLAAVDRCGPRWR